jgi:hypothetical protein
MVGVSLGALLSGALVEYAPAPRTLAYGVIAVLLAVCAILVSLSPETVQPRRAICRHVSDGGEDLLSTEREVELREVNRRQP